MQKNELDFIRSQFPALAGDWIFFDNAGGSQTAKQVGDRIQDYLFHTNVQLGASYAISQEAGSRVEEAQQKLSKLINAADQSEVVLGPSTTQLLHNLSKSMVQQFKPGDEVIVTNCDHEANIGPWINMEKYGIQIKWWKINPDTLDLDLNDLEKLMTDRTKLVAFTHASNVLGTINPIEEITSFVHKRNAMVCVDGVAYAPHRLLDVQAWDVDFYVYSFYKVYGPHYSLLYAKNEHLEKLPGINHFFIGNESLPYKLQPGNVNYELSYGLLGVVDYLTTVQKQLQVPYKNGFKTLFESFAFHEEELAELLLEYLNQKNGVTIFGKNSSSRTMRVPTISFTVDGMNSNEIPTKVDQHQIGIRYGDFYARRLIEDLGLSEKHGVVRVSMVHYNSADEVNRLIDVLDQILP
jgi:cysteine desulfurase family protein (TIGR01976 family)